MNPLRPLTDRELEVLRAMLAPDVPGAPELRAQIVGTLAREFVDGKPSIYLSDLDGGMGHHSNGKALDGSGGGLVLWTTGHPPRLYALEWFGVDDTEPDEFPPASQLHITVATT
jgi:hypothetical protein